MVSLASLFLPNLGTSLTGLLYIVIGILLLALAFFLRIPLLDRILNLVGIGFILFGLFLIFAVSLIEDILSDPTLLSLVIGALLIGVTYYLLFMDKKKRKR